MVKIDTAVPKIDWLTTRPHPPAPQLETLVSYTVPWPDVNLITFLQWAAGAPRIFWESSQTPLSLAGCGIAARITARGPDRFRTVRRDAGRLFENLISLKNDAPPHIGPRLFGGFSFWANSRPQDLWAAFPNALFILPRYQLTRWAGQTWLTINHRLNPQDDPLNLEWLLQEKIGHLRQIAGHQQSAPARQPNRPDTPPTVAELMEPATWHRLVSSATQRIRSGELDKVVLARARRLQTERPIDAADILARLSGRYPNCYRFLFEPLAGHAFYGATPELLAERSGSTLRTVALAGSIGRGATPAEDQQLGQQLLDTPKERSEHNYVVEAIRESLAPLVTNLQVAPQPGLCRLGNIQHIQTPITGQLAAGGNLLQVVEALHPTPALGGRPRRVALQLLNQAEPTPRGWYGAPVGWLDGQGDGMFAVAIRSAVTVKTQSMLFAGAGIVAASEPDREWRETQLKFKPMMQALGVAD